MLWLDNGPEMIAAVLAKWAGTRTGMVFIPPGEPWRNPYIESFNGRLRDECLIDRTKGVSILGAGEKPFDWT